MDSAVSTAPAAVAAQQDASALRAAAADPKSALCTVRRIEGSFSRRVGAQLAVLGDGRFVGDLADGCLEAALASDAADLAATGERRTLRYGAGSHMIDFRLPCGGALDIVVDPAPDRAVLAAAVARLDTRHPVALAIPDGSGEPLRIAGDADGEGAFVRRYVPALKLLVLGAGPEMTAVERVAAALDLDCSLQFPRAAGGRGTLSLGQPPQAIEPDAWTAVLMLFHDHEWEHALIPWALRTEAFFVGAQGGFRARQMRQEMLKAAGVLPERIARLHSPVGLIGHARDPGTLALSAVAEIVAAYEAMAYPAER